MNAKDYFERIRMLQSDMELVQSQILRFRELLEIQSVAYGEKVSTSGVDEPQMPVIIVELHSYIEELENTQRGYIEEHKQAMQVISRVTRPYYKRALTMRYLDNKPYRQIAKELGYTISGAKKLCDNALKHIEPQLNKLLHSS